jgi:hypothetical protein
MAQPGGPRDPLEDRRDDRIHKNASRDPGRDHLRRRSPDPADTAAGRDPAVPPVDPARGNHPHRDAGSRRHAHAHRRRAARGSRQGRPRVAQHAVQPPERDHPGKRRCMREDRAGRHPGGQPDGAAARGQRLPHRDDAAVPVAPAHQGAALLPLPVRPGQERRAFQDLRGRGGAHHRVHAGAYLGAGHPHVRGGRPGRRGQDPRRAQLHAHGQRDRADPEELRRNHLEIRRPALRRPRQLPAMRRGSTTRRLLSLRRGKNQPDPRGDSAHQEKAPCA